MHPSNPYGDLDLASLAATWPALQTHFYGKQVSKQSSQLNRQSNQLNRHSRHVNGNPKHLFKLNWASDRARRELAYALLSRDFGLKLEIPLDSLIPPIPNRLDYVLWVRDLVGEKGHGVDIGTGASCIYPLLGCSKYEWTFDAVGNRLFIYDLDPVN